MAGRYEAHKPSRGLAAARELVQACRETETERAPATLAPAILDACGVGDAFIMLMGPLGPTYIAYNDEGISAVQRHADADAFRAAFRVRFARPTYAAVNPPARLVRVLERVLTTGEGRRDLRFDLRSVSEFERAVLLKALDIPRGEVRPYAWVAREIGSPRAVRAVGTALKHNPIPVLIPCHRVVRSDGTLGMYAGGSGPDKGTLLTGEGVDLARLERLMEAGVRYLGSDTTHISCLPTCRHARRTTEAHLVTFRDAHAAAAAGYRPCKVCRPWELAEAVS